MNGTYQNEGSKDGEVNGDVLPSEGPDSLSQPTRESSDTNRKKRVARPPDLNTSTADVPPRCQCASAETDSGVAEFKRAPTEVMSPRSYSVFKTCLVHVPEINLPWESMRKTSKCGCGVTFSYSIRKVGHKCVSTCMYRC